MIGDGFLTSNRYYLFGRDKLNNKIISIPLSIYDIFNRNSSLHCSYSTLEELDFFTTKFDTCDDLLNYLIKNGKIDHYDIDLFIVSRRGNNCSYLECIYRNHIGAIDLRRLGFSNNYDFRNTDFIDKTIDNFSLKMVNDISFYQMIMAKGGHLYKKFLNYFVGINDDFDYKSVKYKDGSWARKSYPLIRNIVWNMNNRLVNYDYTEYMDKRRLNEGTIMDLTDKNYQIGQYSMFDEEVVEIDKLKFILDNIDSFNINTFINHDGNFIINNKDINSECFSKTRFLDNNVIKLLYYYNYYKNELSLGNSEYLERMNGIVDTLKNYLISNLESLNVTYAFILLYNKYNDKKKCDKNEGYQKRKN